MATTCRPTLYEVLILEVHLVVFISAGESDSRGVFFVPAFFFFFLYNILACSVVLVGVYFCLISCQRPVEVHHHIVDNSI